MANSAIARPTRRIRTTFHQRTGNTLLLVIGALVVAAILGGVVWVFSRGEADAAGAPVLHTVARGPFDHVVLEQGEVDSANNVEVRCEVKSRNTSGTQILSVVPEGSQVKKGDVIVRLDASALERERDQQLIAVNTSKAVVTQADATYATAQIAKIEYLEGTYKQEEQAVLGQVFVAEQNLRNAQLSLDSAQRLLAKGIVTTLQVEGENFLVDKARNELEAAQTQLRVLREYTRAKFLKQYDSDITAAKAKLEAEKSSLALEEKKLLDIEQQIAKCTIEAPSDGQVVYANVQSSRGGSAEFVVEAGANVREGQVLVKLPDPANMQVKAKINEARVTLVREGMPVLVRLDAFSDSSSLRGEVTKVNKYAEPGSWFSSQVKEYATFVRIFDPPPEIRPGLTAEVRIFVERQASVLQIPVQGVFEHGSEVFCIVATDHSPKPKLEARRLTIGSSNDKFVTVKDSDISTDSDGVKRGVKEGEYIVMDHRNFVAKVTLPKVTDTPQANDAEKLGEAGRGEKAPTKGAGGPGAGGPGESGGPGAGGPRGKGAGGPGGGMSGSGGPGVGGPGGGGPGAGGPGGGGAGRGAFDPGAMFARLDANSDGKISADEMSSIPEQFRSRMQQNDTNGDGDVDRAEFDAAMARRRAEGGGPGGPGGPGGGPGGPPGGQ